METPQLDCVLRTSESHSTELWYLNQTLWGSSSREVCKRPLPKRKWNTQGSYHRWGPKRMKCRDGSALRRALSKSAGWYEEQQAYQQPWLQIREQFLSEFDKILIKPRAQKGKILLFLKIIKKTKRSMNNIMISYICMKVHVCTHRHKNTKVWRDTGHQLISGHDLRRQVSGSGLWKKGRLNCFCWIYLLKYV